MVEILLYRDIVRYINTEKNIDLQSIQRRKGPSVDNQKRPQTDLRST